MMLLMETQAHTAQPAGAGIVLQQVQHGQLLDVTLEQAIAAEGSLRSVQEQEPSEQRVMQPLQPVLQLPQIQLLDVQHSSAHVSWPQATYTLPEHDQDEEQVAYQLQVHYRVSYTLQLQQVGVGPPTAEQSADQLLSSVSSAVAEGSWKDVLTLEDAPSQSQKVGSLRAGRFYAVRLRAYAYAELDAGPVFFNDVYTSPVLAFRTVPCAPGQMQAPSLARRDRTLLKLKWNLPDDTGGEVITQYQLKVKPLPAGFAGGAPDEEGFSLIYEGLGEGPEAAKDRTHFTLKPLGPGQKFSFKIRCFNPLGVGHWSLPSTFTTAPSVPSQPDPPQLLHSAEDSVTLCWQAPPDNGSAITFYKLEMDDGRGGDFHHVYGGQSEQLSAIITGLQSGLHYRVRLRAENGEGRSQWSRIEAITTAATLPSCPEGLKLGQITRTAVSLSWSPPGQDGGSPVTGYEVQLLAVTKAAVQDLGSDWLTIYQGVSLGTNWASLRAGCKYQLRVASRNAVGQSQFSIPLGFMTVADAPLPPPRPTALVESRALYINLHPPSHDGGSAVTGYSIAMRCSLSPPAASVASLGSEQRPLISQDWVEVFRGEYKGAPVPVTNLLPGTRYEFTAAAYNTYGTSMSSEVGSASTLPAEPLPPAMPELVSTASNGMTVSWQEPYGQGSVVTKYKLSFACMGPTSSSGAGLSNAPSRGHSRSNSTTAPVTANGHTELGHVTDNADDAGSVGSSSGPAVDKLRWEQAYTGPELSASVKQLLPAHRYLVRVRAINEIGASHWSEPLSAATGAAAPCQPTQLAAAAESSSSLGVSWQPPQLENGAPVTAYHLELQGPGGAAAAWSNVWQGSKLSHVVGGLLPGRKYSLRVRAVNACGAGPWTSPVTASTAPAVPDAPGRPQLNKITATSAKVKWDIPLEINGSSVKAYCLQLRQVKTNPKAVPAGSCSDGNSNEGQLPSQERAWQEVYAGPLLDTTVTKLQPGSSYEVRVAAANAVGLGPWSAAAELATPLRPPPPPADLAAVLDDSQQGSVVVSWAAAAIGPDNAAAVSVYVEATAAGSKEAAAKATVPVAEGSSTTLQGLRLGVSYGIKARTVGAGSTGHSGWCDAVMVSMPAPPPSDDQVMVAAAGTAADTGKRITKGRSGKGASGKSAGKLDLVVAGGDVQQRKAGRGASGKKGGAAVAAADTAFVVMKKPGKKKGLWGRLKQLRKQSWFMYAILALVVVALLVYFIRSKVRA